MKTTGIIIFIIGLVMTIFTTLQFFTKEKVADLGVVEITREKPHTLNWSSLIGVAVMALGGGLFLWKSSKK
jgi:LPXTG-motif cell wall-anchored protein